MGTVFHFMLKILIQYLTLLRKSVPIISHKITAVGEAVEGALKQMQYRSDVTLLQLADLHDEQVRNLRVLNLSLE